MKSLRPRAFWREVKVQLSVPVHWCKWKWFSNIRHHSSSSSSSSSSSQLPGDFRWQAVPWGSAECPGPPCWVVPIIFQGWQKWWEPERRGQNMSSSMAPASVVVVGAWTIIVVVGNGIQPEFQDRKATKEGCETKDWLPINLFYKVRLTFNDNIRHVMAFQTNCEHLWSVFLHTHGWEFRLSRLQKSKKRPNVQTVSSQRGCNWLPHDHLNNIDDSSCIWGKLWRWWKS